jgi:hypothetical protein
LNSHTWRFGRWLSSDWSATPVAVPYANLSNPQTLNLYAMVADDPESFADLDGHDWGDSVDYLWGVARGVACSLSFGHVGAPSANDSTASLTGQLTGSLAVTHISATTLAASGPTALTGLAAAPATGGGSLIVSGGAVTAAAISSITVVGGATNVAAVAKAMSMKEGSAGGEGSGKRATSAQREQAKKESDGKCVVAGCDKPAEHVDHAIARSKNGDTTPENLQGMCAHHNCQKGAKNSAEYAEWLKEHEKKQQ